MIHHATENKPLLDHWAVGWSGKKLPGHCDSRVLVQVQEDGNQARITLSPDEAEAMALQLSEFARQVRATNKE